MQWGSSLDMVLLAFALAHRVQLLRAEKAAAQAEVLQTRNAMVDEQGRSLLAQATLIVSCAGRAGDTVVRYGGEEFAFIAQNIEADAAAQLAQRVCEAVRSLAWPHAGAPSGLVTVSVGVATAWPTAPGATEQLLRQADQALYRAKHQGRDGIHGVVLGDAATGVGSAVQPV